MHYASVGVYRIKPGTENRLTPRLVAELPGIFCRRQGFIAHDLIKAGDNTLICLSMWDSEEQARTALQTATAWYQQHVGDLIDAADTYVGEVAFSWHLAGVPTSP